MRPEPPLRLAVLIGNPHPGSLARVIADWFTGEAMRHGGFGLDVIDLATAELPALLPPRRTVPVERLSARLAEADAFVVVTPEYNHSFPAGLKQAIDLTYDEWHAKPVGFISYGGISGGLRAVEQLRGVFAELHAATVRDTVSFHGAWACFDADGQPHDAEGTSAAVKTLLDQLRWWAHALRSARDQRPYAHR